MQNKKCEERNIKCHNCGKMGHLKRECRAEGGGAYKPSDKKSDYCGKTGHTAFWCWERRADEIRRQEGRDGSNNSKEGESGAKQESDIQGKASHISLALMSLINQKRGARSSHGHCDERGETE